MTSYNLAYGLKVIEPTVFTDGRGYFFETFSKEKYSTLGVDINYEFVQDNESCSAKNVMRGLHYQVPPHAQGKLVRVVKGSVIDFVLDIREGSKTFGQMFFVYLTGENKRQFWIAPGFAHGFISLEDGTIFSYKCTDVYSKEDERGISMLDEKLDVFGKLKGFAEENEIKLELNNLILSEKDKRHPNFADVNSLM